jgi:hypothetical protein
LRVAVGIAFIVGLFSCSLTVSEFEPEVRCADEGAIGPPACEPGFVCGRGRCRACARVEACGDRVDNDCSGAVDEGCSGDGEGGADADAS